MPIRLTLKDGIELIHSDVYSQSEVIIGTDKEATIRLQKDRYDFNLHIVTSQTGTTITSFNDELRVNQGKVIAPSHTTTIRHGDVVRIGDTLCKLHFAYQSSIQPDAPQKSDVAGTRSLSKYVVSSAVAVAVLVAMVFIPFTPAPGFEDVISVTVADGAEKTIDIASELMGEKSEWQLIELKPVGKTPSYVEILTDKSVIISPQEADTPETIMLRLNCSLQEIGSSDVYNHELTINLQCLENANAPVLDLITNYVHDEGSPNHISIEINAIDPDSPSSPLRFQSVGALPENATIDQLTGLFEWELGENVKPGDYSFPIQVFKLGSPQLKTVTILKISLKPTGEGIVETSTTDSLFYTCVYKDDPDRLLPLGIAIAISKEFLLTNAVNAEELAKKLREGWSVVVTPVSRKFSGRQINVTDILAHKHFHISRERFGSNAYENLFFDLGVIKAATDARNVASPLSLTDLEQHEGLKVPLRIVQSNIAEVLVSPEVNQTLLEDRISIKNIDVQPRELGSQRFAVIEFTSFTPGYLDGSLLFAGDKLIGIYSTSSAINDENSPTQHFGCVPVHLSLLGTESQSSVWTSLLPTPNMPAND
tara:strand:- start:3878 stop:5659 length:1782 start_codon:yes stop_codon:yes gene_type:complete